MLKQDCSTFEISKEIGIPEYTLNRFIKKNNIQKISNYYKFLCEKCKVGFCNKSALKNHLRMHHKYSKEEIENAVKIYNNVLPNIKYLKLLSESNKETNKGRKDSIETRLKKSKAQKGRVFSEETKNKIRISKLGDKNPAKIQAVRDKISKTLKEQYKTGDRKPYIHKWTQEEKDNMSLIKTGKIPWSKGKTWKCKKQISEESRERYRQSKLGDLNPHKKCSNEIKAKLRYKMIEYIKSKNDGKFRCIKGKNEDVLLDLQEDIDNCKIDRNFTVDGYFPDGFCHETNAIYEIFEDFHIKESQYIKDIYRLERMQNILNCKIKIIFDLKRRMNSPIVQRLIERFNGDVE